MKAAPKALLAGLALAGGCAGPNRGQPGPATAHVGAPASPVDAGLLSGPLDTPGPGAGREAVRLPDRITLPAAYRLMLLDGRLALVRETDAQSLEGAPTSMRIVAGEIARGELAYQPALLPQELAAEVAANRESSARMDNALGSVMERSRELSAQALELQAESRKLAEMLARAQARIAELEAASRPAAAAKPPGGRAEAGEPQD